MVSLRQVLLSNATSIAPQGFNVKVPAILMQVGVEKTKVNLENEAAQVEAEKCGVIAKDVTELQARCEKDLAAAEPLVAQAEAALDTLNKKDLGEILASETPAKPVLVRHSQTAPTSECASLQYKPMQMVHTEHMLCTLRFIQLCNTLALCVSRQV